MLLTTLSKPGLEGAPGRLNITFTPEMMGVLSNLKMERKSVRDVIFRVMNF